MSLRSWPEVMRAAAVRPAREEEVWTPAEPPGALVATMAVSVGGRGGGWCGGGEWGGGGGAGGVEGVQGLAWPAVRSRRRWDQSCWVVYSWVGREPFFFMALRRPPMIQMTTTMAPKISLMEGSESLARRGNIEVRG